MVERENMAFFTEKLSEKNVKWYYETKPFSEFAIPVNSFNIWKSNKE